MVSFLFRRIEPPAKEEDEDLQTLRRNTLENGTSFRTRGHTASDADAVAEKAAEEMKKKDKEQVKQEEQILRKVRLVCGGETFLAFLVIP